MMKKITDVLILLILCIFLFSGCQPQQTEAIDFEKIANATKIEYTHYISDTNTTEIIENTDTINQIANWLNELLLNEVIFSEDEILTDGEGEERYSFTVYEPEGINIYFDYIINGTEDCYIQYNTKWYVAKNPISLTFLNN